jgi:hypothetical protein
MYLFCYVVLVNYFRQTFSYAVLYPLIKHCCPGNIADYPMQDYNYLQTTRKQTEEEELTCAVLVAAGPWCFAKA